MSFLDKINRFASNPVHMNLKRSKFDLSHSHKTTFNSGDLVPILVDEVLPDDTISIDVASVVRSITPAFPVMDNAYLDIFAFWVPARIATVHEKDWQKIFGENTNGFWAPSTESTLSNTGNTFTINSQNPVLVHSLHSYFGCPIGKYFPNIPLSRIPYNSYWLIWNEWFRDQNIQSPLDWKSFTNGNMNSYGNSICKVNKLHDFFTSCLPSPQKGNSVLLPLSGSAPVKTGSTEHNTNGWPALHVKSTSNTVVSNIGIGAGASGIVQNSGTLGSGSTQIVYSNLYADLTNASAASVNDLRQAFAIQKLLERDARAGSRYREFLMAHFGVSIPDNTVQVPEYLGGKRIPLNMLQTLQTTPTYDSNGNVLSPVGATGAFSNTCDNSKLFTKSFAEFGYIFVLACVRASQSYCQGIPKMLFRDRRYDFYHPVFANLGEQPVYKAQIYADNSSYVSPTVSGAVFGYQEAWAEYRYKPSRISGYLAAGSGDSIAQKWTYFQELNGAPTLNTTFMEADRGQIDKTLVVTNSNYQFIADFWFDYKAWRAMPYFSIPGLVDHH